MHDPTVLPKGTRRHRVVIDSRSRDATLHPTPQKYDVNLLNDIFNVTSMRMVMADVPFAAYLVGPRRRTVPVVVAAGPFEAALPVGEYDNPADLAAELQAALVAASGGVAFEVSYSARSDGFSVSAPEPFTLPLTGRAVDVPVDLLGFTADRDYASSPSPDGTRHAVDAPFRRNFAKDQYVVLKLSPNAELLTSPSQAVDRTFALIPATSETNINVDEEAYIKRWNPPLSRISRFSVEFTDSRGVAYDFQNQDHYIELVIESNVGRSAA